jgi:hypothetical protein
MLFGSRGDDRVHTSITRARISESIHVDRGVDRAMMYRRIGIRIGGSSRRNHRATGPKSPVLPRIRDSGGNGSFGAVSNPIATLRDPHDHFFCGAMQRCNTTLHRHAQCRCGDDDDGQRATRSMIAP